MSQFKNTFEFFAFFLAQLVQPLDSRLQKGEFRKFFAELGLLLPPQVENNNNLTGKLADTSQKVQELFKVVEKLVEAIESKDNAKIFQEGKNIFSTVKPIFDNLKDIADAIKATSGSIASIPQSTINDFANNLPERIFEWLVITNLERISGAAEALEFIGAVERTEKSGTASSTEAAFSYTERKLHLDSLFDFLTQPDIQLKNLYNWDQTNFDGVAMFQKLEHLLGGLGVPAIYDDTAGVLDLGIVEMMAKTDTSPRGLSLIFRDKLPVSETLTLGDDDWELQLGLNAQINPSLVINYFPGNKLNIIPPAGSVEGESFIQWKTANSTEPYVIFGEATGSRLQIEEFLAKISARFKANTAESGSIGDLRILGQLNNGRLVIDTSDGDSFLSSLIGDGIDVGFNVEVGWSSESGIYFDGSSTLELNLPAHVELGPVEIQTLHLGVGLSAEGVPVILGVTAKGELGPFAASVQNIGVKANFSYVKEGGLLGPIDASFDFKFPDGVGLSIDASVIKGGGFLYINPEKGEYAGVAELTIQDTISVKAIGIINTKLPNGEPGFALLLLITAEFTPMQLGFGFTLNGVGGLIGANRGMNLVEIRVGVRNNTLDSILFPEDPVANAPQILANLNSIFPIAQNNHSFGIMAIIGWGVPTLLEVELGLMITFPSFDLAIIGKISTSLPDKKAKILSLNVAFAGTISFEKKYLFFDAAIFDSKLLTFSLSGQMALRILWGDNPNFVLSVGGFHPDFVPPPLELADLERITLNLLADDNPRLTLKCYFAVTSNTVQFGASLDFLFKISKFKVVGFFYFHALFQFDPFYFNVAIGAGLAVKLGSSTILSVSVSGSLEGPTPWKVKGKGKFKILFISFTVSFSETFGDKKDTTLPEIDVFPKLREAILDNRSWQANLQGKTLVSLREIESANEDGPSELILHPFGTLSVSQRVVPLEVAIDVFGNQKPKDFKSFSLSMSIGTNELALKDIKDFFAPAQFFALSDSQKISKNSYEKYIAGCTADATDELQANDRTQKEVEYELTIMDSRFNPLIFGKIPELMGQFNHWSNGTAIAKSSMGSAFTLGNKVAGKKVKFDQEEFVVAKSSDLSAFQGISAASEFEAQKILDDLLLDKPEMEDELMIIPAFELN